MRLVVLTNIYEAYRMCIQESFCQRMGLVTSCSTANTEILFPLPCFISILTTTDLLSKLCSNNPINVHESTYASKAIKVVRSRSN